MVQDQPAQSGPVDTVVALLELEGFGIDQTR